MGGLAAPASVGYKAPNGQLISVLLKSTTPRLVGSIKTKKPSVDVGGGRTVGLAATFDLPVGTPVK